MKKLAILFIAVFTAGLVSAQSPIFEKGNHTFNIGTGLGLRGLPFEFSYTAGIVDDLFGARGLTLGIGGYFGYSFWNSQIYHPNPSAYEFRGWSALFGVRAEVHYSIVDNLDFFGGPMVGFQRTYWENHADARSIFTGAYAGAKYFFTPNFGVYASAGYGIVFLSVGATFQF